MYRPEAADRYRPQRSARRIVLISRDNTRTYTFSPLALFGGLTLFLAISFAFLGATAYLVFRDDLFDLVHERNADMQQAYEDRIARLRSEIDRISSRQILDNVAMDEKVEKILSAQEGIAERQKAVGALIDKARSIGLIDDAGAPAADKHVSLDSDITGSISAFAASDRFDAVERQFDALTGGTPSVPEPPRLNLRTSDGQIDLKAVTSHLAAVDAQQTEAVEAIASAANARVDAAVDVIAGVGVRLKVPEAGTSEDAVGGPFIPLRGAQALAAALQDASQAFGRIETVKAEASRLPLIRPLPGADMTSNYGSRRDPFLGSLAFHAGIDFRSPTGSDVRPTAPGVVTYAGWSGGYGNLVEIDHGNGLTTRYGHMSRILVDRGTRVDRTTVIGEVGSTGRSTGPHLHYETRLNGEPINPVTYINAGNRLAGLLP